MSGPDLIERLRAFVIEIQECPPEEINCAQLTTDLREAADQLEAASNQKYEAALREIATRLTTERNPDGEEQAAYSMQLIARDALNSQPEGEERVTIERPMTATPQPGTRVEITTDRSRHQGEIGPVVPRPDNLDPQHETELREKHGNGCWVLLNPYNGPRYFGLDQIAVVSNSLSGEGREDANLRATARNVVAAWDNPSPGSEKWDRLRQRIEYLREALNAL